MCHLILQKFPKGEQNGLEGYPSTRRAGLFSNQLLKFCSFSKISFHQKNSNHDCLDFSYLGYDRRCSIAQKSATSLLKKTMELILKSQKPIREKLTLQAQIALEIYDFLTKQGRLRIWYPEFQIISGLGKFAGIDGRTFKKSFELLKAFGINVDQSTAKKIYPTREFEDGRARTSQHRKKSKGDLPKANWTNPKAPVYRIQTKSSDLEQHWELTEEQYTAIILLSQWFRQFTEDGNDAKFEELKNRIETMLHRRNPLRLEGIRRLSERILWKPSQSHKLDAETYGILTDAIIRGVQVNFLYKNTEALVEEQMTVHPQCLLFYRDRWYLRANQNDETKLKLYLLKDIRELNYCIHEPAEFVAIDELQGSGYGVMDLAAADEKYIRVELEIFPSVEKWIRRETWHHQQKWTPELDQVPEQGQNRILEFPIVESKYQELVRDLCFYGEGIRVREPEWLAEKVCERLRASLALYQKQ